MAVLAVALVVWVALFVVLFMGAWALDGGLHPVSAVAEAAFVFATAITVMLASMVGAASLIFWLVQR